MSHRLTDQWYVNAEELAKPAIKAVEDGRTKFVPKNWEKTYFEWMRNIQPWCISRQLWWGHRIPAWYGPDGEIFVADDEKAAKALAKKHYNSLSKKKPKDEKLKAWAKSISIKQDEDVLDTWFSSALWPFSTLGWPDETKEVERFYPTSVLVTGFDIIFFWVARMMMLGLKFQDEVPFDTVYIHALVRDEQGAKMSKSKGNIIDPLELVDAYGADALRFTLAAMAAQGRDIKLARNRVEGYRNFATKLWNAARFAEMNECMCDQEFDPGSVKQTVNLWIAGETCRAVSDIETAIQAHRFNEAANAAYKFVWHIYCDWYLELIKPILYGNDEEAKAETRAMTAWTLDQILKILHPFMPFITEELWARIVDHGPKRAAMLILTEWPELKDLGDKHADLEIDWIIRLTTEIRSVRAEMNVAAGLKVPVEIIGADKSTIARIERHDDTIKQLARLDSILISDNIPKGAVQLILDEATIAMPLAGLIDIAAETERLNREIEKSAGEIKKIDAKLGNKKFTERAPEKVVDEQRQRKVDHETTITRLNEALKRFEQAM